MVDSAFAQVDGVLRRAAGSPQRTVVVQTHPRRNSYANMAAWPMTAAPSVGIDTFAFNNRFSNSPAGIDVSTMWEPLALDVAAAVEEMRRRGYRNIILYGTSAGGPLIAFYQHVAERGNAAFEPERTLSGFPGFFDPEGAELRLPAADALVCQNATSGTATSFLLRLDGAIIDEQEAIRDPELDLFNPDNGYDPESGRASYDPAFLQRYHAAQARRMNALIISARETLGRIRALKRPFEDDVFRVIPAVRGYPAFIDLDIAASSVADWTLLPQGTHGTVRSDRAALVDAERMNRSRAHGTSVHTLESFLSYRAISCHPSRYDPFAVSPGGLGIDGDSSNTATFQNLSHCTVPLLITGATADQEVHIPTSELLFNAAASGDKELVFIDGADHFMRDAREGGGGTRQAHLKHVSEWVAERFS